jgi:hypothetical protein
MRLRALKRVHHGAMSEHVTKVFRCWFTSRLRTDCPTVRASSWDAGPERRAKDLSFDAEMPQRALTEIRQQPGCHKVQDIAIKTTISSSRGPR